ncbi:hypothetical protein GCM10008956_30460 [Deinococcus arenae]|uniref:Uncharacterized protein n=1 Tax=Deinococcus arenae TaxID=1452751 RepID=A0A8H9GSB9_9DEIO|nr:hypothetical protein [Deinococcus arenae]GGM52309.1 hypothetical protein GCM10008956_30460 [Deinococcus arenae]
MANLIRQLSSFLRAPERVTLLFAGRADGTAAPVTVDDPLPVTVVGGGGSSEAVVGTYTPQILGAGPGQALTVPAGANRALVQVVTGSARMGLSSATVATEITPGGGRELSDAELMAFRVDVLSGQVRVDYWRVE